MAPSPLKPLVLLCDGTWCGREAGTKTNIYLLAKMIGIPIDNPNDLDEHFFPSPGQPDNGKRARYIHGVGLGSTFLDYVFNAITAQDMAEQCISAYRYIVANYVEGEKEIWMFGLSRGAYTVRCVGGMINNCGIVKTDGLNDNQIDLLCREVYRIYRSTYKVDEPHSDQSIDFRKKASWPLIGREDPNRKPPVRFMGLFDTVGELGIPTFTGGVGLDWPKFYDENVSSVVEHVYQAVSLHDRLYIFQPCLARRDSESGKFKDKDPKEWKITEKWFPGVHYDLGRQRFKFLRDAGGAPLERFLSQVGFASKVIEPNNVLADLALRWMLEAIREHDRESLVIENVSEEKNIKKEIEKLGESIVAGNGKIGDGDVYNRIVEYAPFGELGLKIWRTIAGTGSKVNAISEVLFARRDRHIPDNSAEVYNYKIVNPEVSTNISIKELAGIDDTSADKVENEKKRYPSRTLDAWTLRKDVSQ